MGVRVTGSKKQALIRVSRTGSSLQNYNRKHKLWIHRLKNLNTKLSLKIRKLRIFALEGSIFNVSFKREKKKGKLINCIYFLSSSIKNGADYAHPDSCRNSVRRACRRQAMMMSSAHELSKGSLHSWCAVICLLPDLKRNKGLSGPCGRLCIVSKWLLSFYLSRYYCCFLLCKHSESL